jgi:subtilisin family serine protease
MPNDHTQPPTPYHRQPPTRSRPQPPTREEIYRQIIVTLPTSSPVITARKALMDALDVAGVEFEHLDSIEQLRAELLRLGAGEDVQAVCSHVKTVGVAVTAEQNGVLHSAQVNPPVVDDPLYRHQWALSQIGAEPAWLRARTLVNPLAPGVVVAVVDSGIQTAHPDLVNHLWNDGFGNHGFNIIAGGGNVFDGDGHGTRLAGVIGALSNNALGIAAAEWPLRLMAVKFIDIQNPPTAWSGALAIVLALLAGADIICCAFGVGVPFAVLQLAILLADGWPPPNGTGVLVVAAAGNDGLDNDLLPTFPASYPGCPNLISVMASDRDDDRAWFSNYGLATVHLAAPGVRVLTTDTYFGVPQWREFSGTSASCALVTYAAALIKTINPGWTPTQIRDHLVASVDLGPVFPGPWLRCVSLGRLNLDRAVVGPLAIIAPAANQVWNAGGNELVQWANRFVMNPPVAMVSIEISKNNGPFVPLLPMQPNNGACLVPAGPAAAMARLRIRCDVAPNLFAESGVFSVQ